MCTTVPLEFLLAWWKSLISPPDNLGSSSRLWTIPAPFFGFRSTAAALTTGPWPRKKLLKAQLRMVTEKHPTFSKASSVAKHILNVTLPCPPQEMHFTCWHLLIIGMSAGTESKISQAIHHQRLHTITRQLPNTIKYGIWIQMPSSAKYRY